MYAKQIKGIDCYIGEKKRLNGVNKTVKFVFEFESIGNIISVDGFCLYESIFCSFFCSHICRRKAYFVLYNSWGLVLIYFYLIYSYYFRSYNVYCNVIMITTPSLNEAYRIRQFCKFIKNVKEKKKKKKTHSSYSHIVQDTVKCHLLQSSNR